MKNLIIGMIAIAILLIVVKELNAKVIENMSGSNGCRYSVNN